MALAYSIAVPEPKEEFTEFYILGHGSKAEGYPRKLAVRDAARVTAGIVNHKSEDMSYRVEVNVDGIRNNETGPIVLGHEEKWERSELRHSHVGRKTEGRFCIA